MPQSLAATGTRSMFYRVAPFATYMAFVALLEIMRLIPAIDQILTPETVSLLYPVKIGCAALALVITYKHCNEIHWKDLTNPLHTLLSVTLAVGVFFLWIHLTEPWARLGEAGSGFTPLAAPEGISRHLLIATRFAGTALIVPIIEELFWRSFLIRYLQHTDFTTIRIGAVTPLAFWGTALLFGLEHHLIVAGILAGIAYNIVYWRTASVAQCILSHAITNAILGAYVIHSGKWLFW